MQLWLYDFMIYNLHQYFCNLQNIHTIQNNGNKNIKKNFQ